MKVEKTPRYKISFGASDTEKELNFPFTGELWSGMLTVPNWTNSVTLTIKLKDADGKLAQITTGLAKNQDNVELVINRLICAGEDIVFTLSGAPGGSGGDIYFSGKIINYETR